VEKAFKKLAKNLHPDTEEGDHERMVQLNAARKAALDYVERSKPRDIPEGETRPEETDTI
jgi:curved DNA-binding protein CbpA